MNSIKRNNAEYRIYNYDVIRVISCLFIILIHTTSFFFLFDKSSLLWWCGDIIQNIVRVGLPMFVVLSGALILNGRDEKISHFYSKRLIKIIIPFVIYNFIYIVFNVNYATGNFNIRNMVSYLKIIIEGNTYEHFWYIYMILGVYLCTPFLKKMCKHLDQRELDILFFIILGISIVRYSLSSIGININITDVFVEGWISYYLLGYILTNSNLLIKRKCWFIILGIGSFFLSVFDYRYGFVGIKSIWDFSITMYFQVIALFLFLANIKMKLNHGKQKLLLFLSKYSFEVYLIHGAVMNLISRVNYRFNIMDSTSLIYSFIYILLVIVLSLISAFIVHNILVKPVTYFIVKFVKKSC